MRPRALALVALTAGLLGTAAPALGEPSPSQALFRQRLIDDDGTSAPIKRLLTQGTGIVDPRSGFLDVTGDGRQDALVLVSTGGAAGTVALYVFSTHGRDADEDDALRPIFRLQSLHRATLRVSGSTLTIVEPRWAQGDDLCCPRRLRERDYAFDAKRTTFLRRDDRDVARR